MIPDYTTVIGVDEAHLKKLALVFPNWMKNKPSLLKHPLFVFYDIDKLTVWQVKNLVDVHPDVRYYPWPNEAGVEYPDDPTSRFGNAQRYRMLSGFVHVPTQVKTPYWLKLDLDVVASGQDDWIREEWFEDNPAIIGHPWSYTKPPFQMTELDNWVACHPQRLNELASCPPLNLVPNVGSDLVRHKRIISWCALFNTEFTKFCSRASEQICGKCKLPVPSQDGYLWYCARRAGYGIVRTDMKSRGWIHCSRESQIKAEIDKLNG